MKSCWSIGTLLILLILYTESQARPVTDENCSPKCSGKTNLAMYDVGKTFTYQYTAMHKNDLADATEEKSQLDVKATVKISVISQCEYHLQLSNVEMKETCHGCKDVEAKTFAMAKTMLEAKPMRFGFDNGVVTGVCVSSGENKFSINFKKAVISQFQNSMESLTTSTYVAELDVVGNCLTEYQLTETGIKKKKAITGCSRKHAFSSITNGKPYDLPAEYRKVKLLDGSYECTINQQPGGHLVDSNCKEKHKFNPMSASSDTIDMTINTKLTFESFEDTAKPPQFALDYSTDLSFDHMPIKVKALQAREEDAILKSLCDNLKKSPENIPADFSDLIDLMKNMKLEGITALHEKIMALTCSDKDTILSMFHDALPMVETDASVRFMTNGILNKPHEIPGEYWTRSLSLVRNPSLDMITAVLENLVKQDNGAFVMASGLVKKYCQQNPMCDGDDAIMNFVNYAISVLDTCDKDITDSSFDKILSSLRVLQNIGSNKAWDEKVFDGALKCVNPIPKQQILQGAAMMLLEQMNCGTLSKSSTRGIPDNLYKITEIFELYDFSNEENKFYSHEARIRAFRILIKCREISPVASFVNRVNEGAMYFDEQLAAYMSSYFTNLMQKTAESSDFKLLTELAMCNIPEFIRRTSKSVLSFSQNFKRDFRLRRSEGKLDADVIFEDQSYLPSMLSANVTVDLWGQKVNLLDLNIRQENLQKLTQKFSGKPSNTYSVFDADVSKWFGNVEKGPQVYVAARMFGNEMIYRNSKDVNDMYESMIKGFMKLTSEGVSGSFSRTSKLIDLGISTPTVSGIPMELKVDAVVSGKYNYELKLAKSKAIKIEPRIAARMMGTFRLNAHCTKIGVQASMNFLMNKAVEGTFDMTGDKKTNLKITFLHNPVQERQYYIKLNAGISHLTNKRIQPLTGKGEKNTVSGCTSDVLFEKLNLRYCISYSHPRADKSKGDPGFPFAGPSNVEIYLEKEEGLSFEFNVERPTHKSKNRLFRLAIGTLKNKENILLHFNYKEDGDNKNALIKAVGLGGSYELNAEVKTDKISGAYLRDGKEMASLEGTYSGGKHHDKKFELVVKKDKKKVASIGYQKKKLGHKGQSFKLEASIDTYFPMEFVSKTTYTERPIKTTGKENTRVLRKYMVDLTLGKNKAQKVSGSVNLESDSNGGYKRQVFKYFWKSNNVVIIDASSDITLKKYAANSQTDKKIKGTVYSVQISHKTQRKVKLMMLDYQQTLFISKRLMEMTLSRPKLVEHNLKIAYSKDPKDKIEHNFFGKVALEGPVKGDIKFSTDLTWPKYKVNQEHKLVLNWDTNSKICNFEWKCQRSPDNVKRIFLNHKPGSKNEPQLTNFGVVFGKTEFFMESQFTMQKHVLKINKGETKIVLTNSYTEEEDDNKKVVLKVIKIASNVNIDGEDKYIAVVKIGYTPTLKRCLLSANIKTNTNKLVADVVLDAMTNLHLPESVNDPDLNVFAKAKIPDLSPFTHKVEMIYACLGKKGCSKSKKSDLYTISRDDTVVKQFGYTHDLKLDKKSGSGFEYNGKLYRTGTPDVFDSLDVKFKPKNDNQGYNVEMKVFSPDFGKLKHEETYTINDKEKSFIYTSKSEVDTINYPESNGVTKSTIKVMMPEILYSVKFDYEFLPKIKGKPPSVVDMSVKYYTQSSADNWNEFILNLSPSVGQYVGFIKIGLRDYLILSDTGIESKNILLYKGLNDKSDKSLSFNAKLKRSENVDKFDFGLDYATSFDVIPYKAGELKTTIKISGYDLKKISFNGKLDAEFLNAVYTSDNQAKKASNIFRTYNLKITSSVSAVKNIDGNLIFKLTSEKMNLELKYKRNEDVTLNSILNVGFDIQDPNKKFNIMIDGTLDSTYTQNVLVSVGLGYTYSDSNNVKSDLKLSYNYGKDSYFKSKFNLKMKIAQPREVNYMAEVSSHLFPKCELSGDYSAVDGMPMKSNNELKYGGKKLVTFKFTVLKKLEVSFTLFTNTQESDSGKLSIGITGTSIEADNFDALVNFEFQPFVKKITQKIVYYNKFGTDKFKVVKGKNSQFYIETETTTGYSDLKKFAISGMLTDNLVVYATMEMKAPVLGGDLPLTEITIDGITLKEKSVVAKMKVGSDIQYDLSLKYDFQAYTDMSFVLLLKNAKPGDEASFKEGKLDFKLKEYTINMKVTVDKLAKIVLNTAGTSFQDLTGDFELNVLENPLLSFKFTAIHPLSSLNKNSYEYKLEIEGSATDPKTGKPIVFKYKRVLKSDRSSRTDGFKRKLDIEAKYDNYAPSVSLEHDGGIKAPLLKVHIKYGKEDIAKWAIDMNTNTNFYFFSVSIPNVLECQETLDGTSTDIWKYNLNFLPANDHEILKDYKLTIDAFQKLTGDFKTEINVDTKLLKGLLNNQNTNRKITTNLYSMYATSFDFKLKSKLFFYFDKDLTLELTRNDMADFTFEYYPKYSMKDKTSVRFTLDIMSSLKSVNIKLNSPYEVIEQLDFYAAIQFSETPYKLITKTVHNNKLLVNLDISYDSKKSCKNEAEQKYIKASLTGLVEISMNAEGRLINPFETSECDLPMLNWQQNVDMKDLSPDFQFKRVLYYINNVRLRQVTYTFEAKFRLLVLEYKFDKNSGNFRFEFSPDQRKNIVFSIDQEYVGEGSKTTFKNPARVVEVKRTVEKTVDKLIISSRNHKNSPETSGQFTVTYNKETDEIMVESPVLLKVPLIIRMLSENNDGITSYTVTVRQQGKDNEFFRMKGGISENTLKRYRRTVNKVTLDIRFELIKEQFVQFESTILADLWGSYKYVEYMHTLSTQNGKRVFKAILDPTRQWLITNEDTYKLELFCNHDYKGTTHRFVAFYRPAEFSHEVILMSRRRPFTYSAELNTELLSVKAGMQALSTRMWKAYIVRTKPDGTQMIDYNRIMKFDDNNILTVNGNLSPDLIKDLKAAAIAIYDPQRLVKVRAAMTDNLFKAYSDLFAGFSNPLEGQEALFKYLLEVYNEYKNVAATFQKMYDQDEFYMKTVNTLVFAPMINMIGDCLETCYIALKGYYNSGGLYGKMYPTLKAMWKSIPDNLHTTLVVLKVDAIKTVIGTFYSVCKKVAEMLSAGSEKMQSLRDTVVDQLKFMNENDMPNWMKEHREYIMNNYQVAIEDLAKDDFKDFYETDMKPTMEKYNSMMESRKDMRMKMNKLSSWMRLYFTKRGTMGQKNKNNWEFVKMMMSGNFVELYQKMFQPDEFSIFYNPSSGDFSGKIYVPPMLRKLAKRMAIMRKLVVNTISRSNVKFGKGVVARTYYNVRYYLDNYGSINKIIENFIPPYRQQAWLVGDTSVIPFNGYISNIYDDLPGELLLTRNFVTKDFSVVRAGKSKIIVAYGDSMVTVDRFTGSVMDGQDKKYSLPMFIGNLEVTRDGQRIRVTVDGHSFVDIFIEQYSVKVDIDGRWHGQMAGAMGTNDFNSPKDYTNKVCWTMKTTGDCKRKSSDFSTVDVKKFRKLGLERCFPVVKPEPYIYASNYFANNMNSTKVRCPFINAYTLRCREAGVLILAGSECETQCKRSERGSKKKGLLHKMHYIYVMEEAKCMNDKMETIQKLTETLVEQRSGDMFSLLTFRADRKGVSTYTSIEGADTFTSAELKTVLQTVKDKFANLDSSSTKNAVEALYSGLMLPVERRMMHSIYLFTCSPCADHKVYTSATLNGLMKMKKISVQYFTTGQNFGDSSTLGVTRNEVLRLGKSKKLEKDPSLYGVAVPRDMCAGVARNVGDGAVWSLDAIKTSGNTEVYTKIKNLSIGSQFYKSYSDVTQICVCQRDKYGSPQESCEFHN